MNNRIPDRCDYFLINPECEIFLGSEKVNVSPVTVREETWQTHHTKGSAVWTYKLVSVSSPHSPFLSRQTWDSQSQRRLRPRDKQVCLLCELPEETRWWAWQRRLCSGCRPASAFLSLLEEREKKTHTHIRSMKISFNWEKEIHH